VNARHKAGHDETSLLAALPGRLLFQLSPRLAIPAFLGGAAQGVGERAAA
jgi:hypothetical protein